MKITVSKSIRELCPKFNVLAFSFDAKCEETNDKIKAKIKELENYYKNVSLEEVINLERIKEGRDAYKKFGKDPSRYRIACESLLRRLSKSNELYIINNLVDIGNVLSIELNRPTAVLDYDKIEGDVYIRFGTNDDEYYGIGRGLLNVSNIPLYCDSVSPFGSPTSDTLRTSISLDTKKVLLFVICFSDGYILESKKQAYDLFNEFSEISNFTELEVSYE